MSEETTLIAGFPAAAWEKFLAQIPAELVAKDPNRMDYVKHQVCIGMLNECFGPDGWRQEIVEVWMQPEYTYKAKKNRDSQEMIDKPGRAYAEALVRLTILKPGSDAEPAVRENIGSQVAGGDWAETRKGAVSEGLKRAASLFGWAPNVYKTEAFNEWEERTNGNGGTQQQEQRPKPAPAPAPAQAQRKQKYTVDDIKDSESLTMALQSLGITTPAQLSALKAAAQIDKPRKEMNLDEMKMLFVVASGGDPNESEQAA